MGKLSKIVFFISPSPPFLIWLETHPTVKAVNQVSEFTGKTQHHSARSVVYTTQLHAV